MSKSGNQALGRTIKIVGAFVILSGLLVGAYEVSKIYKIKKATSFKEENESKITAAKEYLKRQGWNLERIDREVWEHCLEQDKAWFTATAQEYEKVLSEEKEAKEKEEKRTKEEQAKKEQEDKEAKAKEEEKRQSDEQGRKDALEQEVKRLQEEKEKLEQALEARKEKETGEAKRMKEEQRKAQEEAIKKAEAEAQAKVVYYENFSEVMQGDIPKGWDTGNNVVCVKKNGKESYLTKVNSDRDTVSIRGPMIQFPKDFSFEIELSCISGLTVNFLMGGSGLPVRIEASPFDTVYIGNIRQSSGIHEMCRGRMHEKINKIGDLMQVFINRRAEAAGACKVTEISNIKGFEIVLDRDTVVYTIRITNLAE